MVRIYVFDHQEAYRYGITKLPELEASVEIVERCDCYETHGRIMHLNGGRYHAVIRLFEITPEEYVITYEDTREPFDVEELLYIVVELDNEEKGRITLKSGETAYVITKEEVEKLLKYYEETADYTVYYVGV